MEIKGQIDDLKLDILKLRNARAKKNNNGTLTYAEHQRISDQISGLKNKLQSLEAERLQMRLDAHDEALGEANELLGKWLKTLQSNLEKSALDIAGKIGEGVSKTGESIEETREHLKESLNLGKASRKIPKVPGSSAPKTRRQAVRSVRDNSTGRARGTNGRFKRRESIAEQMDRTKPKKGRVKRKAPESVSLKTWKKTKNATYGQFYGTVTDVVKALNEFDTQSPCGKWYIMTMNKLKKRADGAGPECCRGIHHGHNAVQANWCTACGDAIFDASGYSMSQQFYNYAQKVEKECKE